jgi:cardiolipin synthase
MKFNMHENYDFANGYFKQNQDNTDMFRYTYQSELKPVYECNNIEPINNNTQLLENVVQLIRKAEKFIHYETYIICDGFFLRTVIAELIKKAETGVKVRFLYD